MGSVVTVWRWGRKCHQMSAQARSFQMGSSPSSLSAIVEYATSRYQMSYQPTGPVISVGWITSLLGRGLMLRLPRRLLVIAVGTRHVIFLSQYRMLSWITIGRHTDWLVSPRQIVAANIYQNITGRRHNNYRHVAITWRQQGQYHGQHAWSLITSHWPLPYLRRWLMSLATTMLNTPIIAWEDYQYWPMLRQLSRDGLHLL